MFTLSAVHAGMAVGKLTGGLSGAHSAPYLSSLEHTKANLAVRGLLSQRIAPAIKEVRESCAFVLSHTT